MQRILSCLLEWATIKALAQVNTPNAIVIAIINYLEKPQRVATFILTILSILSTGLILWRNLNKKTDDKK